ESGLCATRETHEPGNDCSTRLPRSRSERAGCVTALPSHAHRGTGTRYFPEYDWTGVGCERFGSTGNGSEVATRGSSVANSCRVRDLPVCRRAVAQSAYGRGQGPFRHVE